MSIKGSTFVLKKGTASGGPQIAAGRSLSLSFAGETVDVTTVDDTNRWRQLIAATGIKSATVTLSGKAKDVATALALMTDFSAQTVDAYGIVIGTLATVDGNWMITSLEFTGEYNNTVDFSATLESAGDLTIASVA